MKDRISFLPDELLCHILSFLPTKLAFTTTIISKRWTPLFYSLPVLHFDDEDESYETFVCFSRLVDNLMLSPLAANIPLKKFHLKCRFGFENRRQDEHIINTLLESVKRRRVEEFDLTLHLHTLSPIIFISSTLVVLKLHMLEIGDDTSCVNLPSLKTFGFYFVIFQKPNDYINFLSACPNLENLHAKSIYIQQSGMNRIKNNAPEEGFKSLTLSKLVRASILSMDALLFNGINNIKYLRITIKYPSEACLKFIPLFPNLIHIDLVFSDYTLNCWDVLEELLPHFPKLQILFIKKLSSYVYKKERRCPFSVFECVSSHLRSCTILNFDGSKNDLQFATYILQNASLLQLMTIGITTKDMVLEKSMIIEELSSCPMISLGCKLSFQSKYIY